MDKVTLLILCGFPKSMAETISSIPASWIIGTYHGTEEPIEMLCLWELTNLYTGRGEVWPRGQ